MTLFKGAKWIVRKNLFVITLRKIDASIKDIWLNGDETEKYLCSNKFMRSEDVISAFLKKDKRQASGLLKIAYKA